MLYNERRLLIVARLVESASNLELGEAYAENTLSIRNVPKAMEVAKMCKARYLNIYNPVGGIKSDRQEIRVFYLSCTSISLPLIRGSRYKNVLDAKTRA